MANLYDDIPEALPDELFDVIASAGSVEIERIVSRGHASPAAGWYDQARDEFVLLLRGAARLEFEHGSPVDMAAGDWLNIPAHRRHRVAWTDPDRDTVWLAVHYDPSNGDADA